MNLKELQKLFLLHKKITISIFFATTLTVFFLSFLLPDKYVAKALVKNSAESNESGFSSTASGGLSALAALGGVSIGQESNDPIEYSMAVLKSVDFLSELLKIDNIKRDLVAARSFNKKLDKINYKENYYDVNKNSWVRDIQLLEIHKKHYIKNLTLTKNRANGFLEISFTHVSPGFASYFVNLLIEKLNELIREREALNSRSRLDYLVTMSESSNQAQVKKAISSLTERYLQNMAVSSTRVDYIVTVIDQAYPPHKSSFPKRWLFILLGMFSGFFCSILFLLSKQR